MSKFSQKWAGRAYGTNSGNLFVEFTSKHDGGTGCLRLLDDRHGLLTYQVSVSLNEGNFNLTGSPADQDNLDAGEMTATGLVSPRGSILGDWKTTGGYAGTFELFPHGAPDKIADGGALGSNSVQLYTKRLKLGPVNIDREGLIQLGRIIDKEMPSGEVIISVVGDTEQSFFLSDFESRESGFYKAKLARLYIQEQETESFIRILCIEFGQFENFVWAQSVNESWAIGVVERLRRHISGHELPIALSFSRVGVGINQIIFLSMIAYLPSIDDTAKRFAYVIGVAAIISGIYWFHRAFVPNASILLSQQKISPAKKQVKKFSSWIVGLAGASLAVYLTTSFDELWQGIGLIVSKP